MKRLGILLSVVVLLSGCAAPKPNDSASSVPPAVSSEDLPEPEIIAPSFDIEAYKVSAADLCDEIQSMSIILGNMGKWEKSFMETLGRPSDDVVSRAYEWLEKEAGTTQDDVEASNEKISTMLLDLASSTEGEEADAIFEQVSSLHGNYIALYSVVTTPPLSVADFGTEFSEYFSAVASDLDELKVSLDTVS